MAIESKNLLVWVKAMSRGQALPLDASEVYASLAEAQNYASTSAIAYAGQTVKAMTEDGKYHSYTLQPSEAGYVLEEIGAIKASDLKQYVMVVEALPESGMEQGILYIVGTDGYIYTGSEWKKVFWDVTADVDAMGKKVEAVEKAIDDKAPIANPVFSGTVKVGEEEVALKSYVDGLFANLEETCATPAIVDSENPIPADYKAGYTYRVAEAGTYAGVECEVGDLILVVKDYAEGTASDADFMVLQANIDGAVTSTADVSTVGEIVVFDAVTGRVIKGSGVNIASLNDAIAKAHEHANKEVLDTYNKSQTELLAAAKSEAEGLVAAHESAVNTALEGKADKATTLAGYGITDAYTTTQIDGKLQTIAENLNTKVTATDVESKIEEHYTETVQPVINGKADKSDSLEGYGITNAYTKTEVDNLLTGKADKATTLEGYGITDAMTSTQISNLVSETKTATLSEAATAAGNALEARVGNIPADTTIQAYVESAVGSGGVASAEAIATAKQEAIETAKGYTDGQISALDASLKSYVDQQDGVTLASAKTYTDEQIVAALTVAEF